MHVLAVSSTLVTAAVVLVLAAMLWVSQRIEVHWVDKTGRRMICMAQEVRPKSPGRDPVPSEARAREARSKEVRVAMPDDGTLLVTRRSSYRRITRPYRMVAAMPPSPTGTRLYVIRPVDASSGDGELVLQIPPTSRALARLDAMLPPRLPPS